MSNDIFVIANMASDRDSSSATAETHDDRTAASSAAFRWERYLISDTIQTR